MVSTNRRAKRALPVLLAGMAGTLTLFLAAPAGAQTGGPSTSGGARATSDSVASGTCVAVDDSVCSGSGTAVDDSTSSGAAHARDGSVSSGCATAVDDSTASGAPCPPTPPTTVFRPPPPHGDQAARPGTSVPAARSATPTATRTLALTGSSTGELAAGGALALLAGALLVKAARKDDVPAA